MASSSWNRGKSSSNGESLESIPFLSSSKKGTYPVENHDITVGLELKSEDLTENLDDLTEDELDELLQEAWDINKRLKMLERRCNSLSGCDSIAEHESAKKSTGKQNYFLPSLLPTKTPLVARVGLATGPQKGPDGRKCNTAGVI